MLISKFCDKIEGIWRNWASMVLLHFGVRSTECYRMLDMGHPREFVQAHLINIVEVEKFLHLNFIYVINLEIKQASRNISVHQAYPNRQSTTAGSMAQAVYRFDFGKVFSALLTNAAMMNIAAARCILGSAVCCLGIGIPRFWHLVVWVGGEVGCYTCRNLNIVIMLREVYR